jgi:hypothetical protein
VNLQQKSEKLVFYLLLFGFFSTRNRYDACRPIINQYCFERNNFYQTKNFLPIYFIDEKYKHRFHAMAKYRFSHAIFTDMDPLFTLQLMSVMNSLFSSGV